MNCIAVNSIVVRARLWGVQRSDANLTDGRACISTLRLAVEADRKSGVSESARRAPARPDQTHTNKVVVQL